MLDALADKRVVFVGDSTLRYEYLALAYLAEHGVLPSTGHLLCSPHAGWPNVQVAGLWQGSWKFLRDQLPPDIAAYPSEPSPRAASRTVRNGSVVTQLPRVPSQEPGRSGRRVQNTSLAQLDGIIVVVHGFELDEGESHKFFLL